MLFVITVSLSDVDDLIPALVAWQIEWNKMHKLLHSSDEADIASHQSTVLELLSKIVEGLHNPDEDFEAVGRVKRALHLGDGGWERLRAIWKDQFWLILLEIAIATKSFSACNIDSTHIGHARVVRSWWHQVMERMCELGYGRFISSGYRGRPLHIIFGNPFSFANIFGRLYNYMASLADFARNAPEGSFLNREYQRLTRDADARNSGDWTNFLYHIASLREWLSTEEGIDYSTNRIQHEEEVGIFNVPFDKGSVAIGVQIIDPKKSCVEKLDPRLRGLSGISHFSESNEVIVNMDYPLGHAAYRIVREILEAIGLEDVHALWVVSKAAVLASAGEVGDVLVPRRVLDLTGDTGNEYHFVNSIDITRVGKYLQHGSVRRATSATVAGTMLENKPMLKLCQSLGFNDLEMELGRICDALAELNSITRHPKGALINLGLRPILGVAHYASDSPDGERTLARSLSYFGVDSATACALTVVESIIAMS